MKALKCLSCTDADVAPSLTRRHAARPADRTHACTTHRHRRRHNKRLSDRLVLYHHMSILCKCTTLRSIDLPSRQRVWLLHDSIKEMKLIMVLR